MKNEEEKKRLLGNEIFQREKLEPNREDQVSIGLHSMLS
jgi:hypothetical protein